MPSFFTKQHAPSLVAKMAAWTGVLALVLLTWLAADPSSHAWLHDKHLPAAHMGMDHGCSHSDPDANTCSDPGCIITQWAQGHLAFLGFCLLLLNFRPRSLGRLLASLQFQFSPDAHVLPPGRGPPAQA